MYGIINYCFELLFTSHYGAQCWERIKKDAGIQISGSFVQRAIYKDKSTFDILNSAVKILNVPSNVILEQFGRMFIVLSEETGDDMLLRALGENPKDFVQNLDTLHNHLATVYPEMRPPSFNCKEAEGGTLVIEYYSERVGLDHIVIGLIEEASERILKRPVKVELMEVKGALLDHTRFRVIPQGEWHETVAVVEHGGLADHQLTSLALPLLLFTMCPFHILFDRALRIQQVGQTLCRILGTRLHDCDLSKMFQMERPYIKLTIENILAHLNSVFVLCTTLPVIGIDGHQCKRVRLKGQMIYLTESNLVLYLSSPVVGSLDDLATRGLHLSDLKVYDPIRNLILLSEHFLVQYQITKSLEELTKQLQETNRALDKEKQMTDNLLYSVLPPKVADDLRNNRPVPARKYDPITLLFVGIAHFGHFCARHSTNAFKIVNLLNTLYTKFDAVIDRDCRVYKPKLAHDRVGRAL